MDTNCTFFKLCRTIFLFGVLSFLTGWTAFGDAKIDVSCGINGFGSGNCTFTNTGDGSGKVCGAVILVDALEREIQSNTICSGEIDPSESKSIPVHISGADDHCPRSYNCTYYWKKN